MGSLIDHWLPIDRESNANSPPSLTSNADLKEKVGGILGAFNQSPREFDIRIDKHEVVIAGPPIDLNLVAELILRLQPLVGDRQIHIEELWH